MNQGKKCKKKRALTDISAYSLLCDVKLPVQESIKIFKLNYWNSNVTETNFFLLSFFSLLFILNFLCSQYFKATLLV